jgi:hypothetical protein
MYLRDIQKGLDSISARLGIEPQYTQKFFSDYEFAKLESTTVGLRMTPQLYDQLVEGFKRLTDAQINAERFDKIWEDSNKTGKASKANDDRHTNSHQWH